MARVPVKLVDWGDIVEWSLGLSNLIRESGYEPDVVIAVSRGGFVPARLLCDFLDVTNLLSIQSQHWVEAARMAEKAILKFPYRVDLSGLKALLVDDIVDTGDTLLLAKEFIEKEWKPGELRVAALQWISSVAKFKPDYYYMEVSEWAWFQYPWTRLEDTMQFITRLFREHEDLRGKAVTAEKLEEAFKEFYGIEPGSLGFYWKLALERLVEKGVLERVDGGYKLSDRSG
ncbi:purine phosphoribosyltransferase [Aeropyrum pernix]|uniref:Purine phosphoribosyltransferase n=1 Tax=Aeropyrum pernix TaxID=56636 RepID=A0A401H8E0_AERPX|nr:phosphoribosyltransferase [Aeropyrum pernix]GBF08736.1 purine phosphoribosyltransferase [Aeropyrum pernix]